MPAEDTGLTERPIWHDDGDIILHVSEGKIEHQFRIHSLILRVASSVFQDMLAMPRTTDTDPMLEGCPLVALDDSPEDLCAFLNALYKGLAMLQSHHLDLDSALGILLLSDKYAMDNLREGIIRVIQEDWPLNRSDYLARQRLLGSPGCRLVQSVKIIKTARRCNAAELLPTAFYELSASSIRLSTPEGNSALNRLSQDDLACLLVGRTRSEERLRILAHALESRKEGYAILWNKDTNVAPIDIFRKRRNYLYNCGSGPICTNLAASFLRQVGKQLLEGKSAINIVLELGKTRMDGVCMSCGDWLTDILVNKEQELWENIPVDFGLPKIDPKFYSESMFKTL